MKKFRELVTSVCTPKSQRALPPHPKMMVLAWQATDVAGKASHDFGNGHADRCRQVPGLDAAHPGCPAMNDKHHRRVSGAKNRQRPCRSGFRNRHLFINKTACVFFRSGSGLNAGRPAWPHFSAAHPAAARTRARTRPPASSRS